MDGVLALGTRVPGVLRAGSWTAIGAVASRGALIFASFVVSRAQGQAGFANFALVQSTVAVAVLLGSLGLGLTAAKRIKELVDEPERLGQTIHTLRVAAFACGGTAAVSLLLGSRLIADFVLLHPSLELPLQISAMQTFCASISVLEVGILFGLGRIRAHAIGHLLGAVIGVLGVAMLSRRIPQTGPYFGMTIGALAAVLMLRRSADVALRAAKITVLRGPRSELGILMGFSIPVTLSALLVTPTIWVCNLLLVRSATGADAVATFNVAWQWFSVVAFLPSIASQLLVPALSPIVLHGDFRRAKKIVNLAEIAFSAAAAIAVAPLFIFASAVTTAYKLLDPSATTSFRIMMIAAVLSAAASPLGHLLLAASRAWAGFAMNLGWCLFVIAGCIWSAATFGALGMSWVVLVGYVLLRLCASIYVRRNVFTAPASS